MSAQQEQAPVADTGGSAFPMPGIYDAARDQINPVSEYYDAEGMTLRDYFAAKAMQGLLACGEAHEEATAFVTARAAYTIADAMLAARGVR